MTKYEKEILTLLKKAFEKVVGVRPYQCEDEDCRYHYYLKNMEDNFFLPMSEETHASFKSGNGSEIKKGKINALRSSAALTYNLFGNGAAIFKEQKERDDQKEQLKRIGEGVYTVTFEAKYLPLKKKVSSAKSNLDAFLFREDACEAVACEMKMLEWIINSNQGKLSDSYLSKKSYIDDDAGKIFSGIAEKLKNEVKTKKIKNYDAFQMFKHTVACYRACFDKEAEPRIIKKLTLANCIWTLPESAKIDEDIWNRHCTDLHIIKGEFGEFKEIMQPVVNLFKEKGFDFDIVLYTFNDFLALLEKDKEELDYLRRYTFEGLNLTD